MTEEQAIRQAVEQRIDSLDDSFIGAVRAFEVAARAQSLDDIAGKRSMRYTGSLPVSLHTEWRCSLGLGKPDVITAMSLSVTLSRCADRLSAIEHEVMQQVGTKLPPEMILLDQVQQISSR